MSDVSKEHAEKAEEHANRAASEARQSITGDTSQRPGREDNRPSQRTPPMTTEPHPIHTDAQRAPEQLEKAQDQKPKPSGPRDTAHGTVAAKPEEGHLRAGLNPASKDGYHFEAEHDLAPKKVKLARYETARDREDESFETAAEKDRRVTMQMGADGVDRGDPPPHHNEVDLTVGVHPDDRQDAQRLKMMNEQSKLVYEKNFDGEPSALDKKNRKALGIRLPWNVYNEIKRIADRDHRDVNSQITHALEHYCGQDQLSSHRLNTR